MPVPWMSIQLAKDLSKKSPDTSKFKRDPFSRDYAILVHSTFVRRLSNKTQVYSLNPNDHTRTRLTHSLEVSQIGAQLAKYFSKKMNKAKLFPNEFAYLQFATNFQTLTMAACLAHDVGHPPFGHKGAHLLSEYADSVGSEFDDNKQVAHMLISPALYENVHVTASLVAATFKKTNLRKISYTEDQQQIESVIDHLGLNEQRHPASLMMEAADDIAYIAADLEDYLNYFFEEDKTKFIELLQLSNLAAVDENYNYIGPLDQVVLKILKLDAAEENIQLISSAVLRSLVFATCNHIDDFFRNTSGLTLKNIPLKLTEYLDANCFKDKKPEQSLLYLANGSNKGSIIKLIKDQLYNKVLSQKQVGRQDIIAEKVISELIHVLSPVIKKDGLESDAFKMFPSGPQGLMKAGHKREQSLTPQRSFIDFFSGMTDRYALNLWEQTKNPFKLVA